MGLTFELRGDAGKRLARGTDDKANRLAGQVLRRCRSPLSRRVRRRYCHI